GHLMWKSPAGPLRVARAAAAFPPLPFHTRADGWRAPWRVAARSASILRSIGPGVTSWALPGWRSVMANAGVSGAGGWGALYRIWTSREALAKARGRGLVEAADGIDRVAGVTNGLQLRRIGGEEWWLMQATPAQGLALALAFNRGVDGHATARPAGMRLRTAKPSQIDPTGPFTQGIAMTCGLDPIWPSANRAGREL